MEGPLNTYNQANLLAQVLLHISPCAGPCAQVHAQRSPCTSPCVQDPLRRIFPTRTAHMLLRSSPSTNCFTKVHVHRFAYTGPCTGRPLPQRFLHKSSYAGPCTQVPDISALRDRLLTQFVCTGSFAQALQKSLHGGLCRQVLVYGSCTEVH